MFRKEHGNLMDDSQTYNRRQFGRMLQVISAYENHQTTLQSLVSDLESLVGVLQGVPVEWTDSFRQKWGVLDDVWADMANTQQTQMDEFRARLISNALRALKQQIEAAL